MPVRQKASRQSLRLEAIHGLLEQRPMAQPFQIVAADPLAALPREVTW